MTYLLYFIGWLNFVCLTGFIWTSPNNCLGGFQQRRHPGKNEKLSLFLCINLLQAMMSPFLQYGLWYSLTWSTLTDMVNTESWTWVARLASHILLRFLPSSIQKLSELLTTEAPTGDNNFSLLHINVGRVTRLFFIIELHFFFVSGFSSLCRGRCCTEGNRRSKRSQWWKNYVKRKRIGMSSSWR